MEDSISIKTSSRVGIHAPPLATLFESSVACKILSNKYNGEGEFQAIKTPASWDFLLPGALQLQSPELSYVSLRIFSTNRGHV